uniref:Uncharacterized protein n=1 Tax=Mycena chlorophos TaxID=658473 RepID=A0ABQ0KY25_MYCCL|nr:predicted protein [Mycena chlorophos]
MASNLAAAAFDVIADLTVAGRFIHARPVALVAHLEGRVVVDLLLDHGGVLRFGKKGERVGTGLTGGDLPVTRRAQTGKGFAPARQDLLAMGELQIDLGGQRHIGDAESGHAATPGCRPAATSAQRRAAAAARSAQSKWRQKRQQLDLRAVHGGKKRVEDVQQTDDAGPDGYVQRKARYGLLLQFFLGERHHGAGVGFGPGSNFTLAHRCDAHLHGPAGGNAVEGAYVIGGFDQAAHEADEFEPT